MKNVFPAELLREIGASTTFTFSETEYPEVFR